LPAEVKGHWEIRGNRGNKGETSLWEHNSGNAHKDGISQGKDPKRKEGSEGEQRVVGIRTHPSRGVQRQHIKVWTKIRKMT